MKNTVLAFLFIFISLQAWSQVEVPVFGKISYLKGYTREIKGENITYFSALPEFASMALLTRCTDGKYDIEWETETVPLNYSGKYVYFAWVAAHSKNTSKGDRKFDLYVNEQKSLTFETYKAKSTPFWTFSGAGESAVVFEWKTDDGAGDSHGYMYLKVPVSSIEKGKPVKLKIVGQAQDSRDWYMTFKYEFEEKVTINPVSLVTNDEMQPMQVMATHFGKDTPITLLVDGDQKYRFTLKSGLNTFEIFHKVVDTVTRIKVEVIIPGQKARSFDVDLKPLKFREIHLIHHAHYDVGYSHLQEEVIDIHNKNIANALRYIDQTRDLPTEAQYKWNIETTLAIENFLKIASPDQKSKLVQAIRNGKIGIGGLYANIMTGICQPEELFQFTSYAQELEKAWGIRIPAVMIGDIPGLTWASIAALCESGIRYFSNGPNFVGAYPYEGDRVGNSNINWKDRPFWWVTPDGTEKMLFWMAGKGYSSWHGFKAGDIATPRGKKRISAYMDELDQSGYPYEMVQWRYNIVADNGPTDSLISNFVLDWNHKYKSPKMVLNTVDAMFSAFEKRYGDQLPVFSGDMSPYWEDGAYSSAAEMAMNRLNSEKLTSLSTLYSLADPEAYPTDLVTQAWKKILLWDEHTWGAYNSISDPDLPFVLSQWNYKKQYATDADVLIRQIEEPLLRGGKTLPGFVDVYNTLSWQRKDVIYLDKEVSILLKEVRDENGSLLTSQRLSDGRVAVQLTVPPMSSSRLKLIRSDQAVELEWPEVATDTLKNENLEIEFSPETGSIKQLKYLPLSWQFVDTLLYTGLNEYLYVPGKDPGKAVTNATPTAVISENGPVLTSVIIKGEAEGTHSLSREVILFRDLNRVEIRNTVDKKAIREKESVHFAFPFNIPDATERFNTGWGGIFQPGVDQLAGSNQDYYSVQHWCDVSNQSYGITLLLKEACLIEPGKMLDEQPGKYGVKTWKTKPDLNPTLFSYVMNNYWHTNYKADQEGPVTFTYALIPHGLFNLGETQRNGLAFNQPLLVLPAVGEQKKLPLFTLSNPNVIATLVEPTQEGFRIRLFNAGGVPGVCKMEWNAFKPSGMVIKTHADQSIELKAGESIEFPEFGIVEVEVRK
ncbi:MAG: glycoside hydrolase [Bacteroidales bacterium]|nr:glycoside hydrolase [Bacteroidales bacterium]